jgi:hypothetical protein
MLKAIMPKGTYYIGDPCYIIKGNPGYIWIDKLWDIFYNHNDQTGVLDIDGVKLFIRNSYEGDGDFDGFYVDSGCIAIIKIDALLKDERFDFNNMSIKGTKFIAFPNDFTITFEEGKFNIGNTVVIQTNLE